MNDVFILCLSFSFQYFNWIKCFRKPHWIFLFVRCIDWSAVKPFLVLWRLHSDNRLIWLFFLLFLAVSNQWFSENLHNFVFFFLILFIKPWLFFLLVSRFEGFFFVNFEPGEFFVQEFKHFLIFLVLTSRKVFKAIRGDHKIRDSSPFVGRKAHHLMRDLFAIDFSFALCI